MRQILDGCRARWPAILLYLLLLAGGWTLAETLRGVVIPEMRPMNEPLIHRLVMSALLLYVVTAAIPFVPGAEIGFALLLIFGAPAAPLVYGGMVGALFLAFTIARFLPADWIDGALRRLRLTGSAELLERFRNVGRKERLDFLAAQLPGRVAPIALRNRYLLLALLINTPGNSLLGGGGGLAMAAGLSRLFAPVPYAITVLIAVAPIPLAIVILDRMA